MGATGFEEEDGLDAEARRLIGDPDMQLMARKAMENKSPTGNSMMEDPEMHAIARKAMNDPTMMKAVMAMGNSRSSNIG